MLYIEEPLELEESLRDELNNHLEEILNRLNRFGHLKVLLSLLSIGKLLGITDEAECSNGGKIIVNTLENLLQEKKIA